MYTYNCDICGYRINEGELEYRAADGRIACMCCYGTVKVAEDAPGELCGGSESEYVYCGCNHCDQCNDERADYEYDQWKDEYLNNKSEK